VLLGIPGNHDWYDGLDGFGRLFRRSPLEDLPEPVLGAPAPASSDSGERVEGALVRQLHVDELAESLRLAGEAWEALAAILLGSTVRKPAASCSRGTARSRRRPTGRCRSRRGWTSGASTASSGAPTSDSASSSGSAGPTPSPPGSKGR
jgi:hypothetical protein